jgi:hypothetical protein
MGNLIKFTPYDAETAEEEGKQFGGNRNYVKLAAGKNRLRMLPAEQGQKSPMKIVKQHSIEVEGKDFPVRFECLDKNCPACAEESRLSRTGNPHDRKRSNAMRAKTRVFAPVVVRGQEEEGVKVWEFGPQIHEQLRKLRKNEDAGGDFTNPYTGFDLIVDREGTGMDTSYQVFPSRQSSKLCDDEEQALAWCETRPNLEEYSKVLSIEEAAKIVRGEVDEGEDRPQRRQLPGRQQPKDKRRTAQDDLDAEEDA